MRNAAVCIQFFRPQTLPLFLALRELAKTGEHDSPLSGEKHRNTKNKLRFVGKTLTLKYIRTRICDFQFLKLAASISVWMRLPLVANWLERLTLRSEPPAPLWSVWFGFFVGLCPGDLTFCFDFYTRRVLITLHQPCRVLIAFLGWLFLAESFLPLCPSVVDELRSTAVDKEEDAPATACQIPANELFAFNYTQFSFNLNCIDFFLGC